MNSNIAFNYRFIHFWQFPFSRKATIQEGCRGYKKNLPTKNGEEFSLVAGVDEISNFKLLLDIKEIVGFLSR
jgi:hypothetical protein